VKCPFQTPDRQRFRSMTIRITTPIVGACLNGGRLVRHYDCRAAYSGVRPKNWVPTKVSVRKRKLDYAFAVPELAQRVTACEFDHTSRLLRETDHSALNVSLTRTYPQRADDNDGRCTVPVNSCAFSNTLCANIFCSLPTLACSGGRG
jgi:hypothetical protein